MLVHSCIAVTDQGIPLGIIYQETNTREKPRDDSQTKEQKRSRPIEEKENFRWLDSMRETLLRMPADIPILTVCDREGDFYEFFSEAADLKANFLIRIVQNRMVDDGKKIFHELRSSPVAGSMVVRMSRNPKEHIPSRNIKKEIPESYSLKEAIYDLGVLGGTKGAPSDGMPGVRSIWQGLDVLYSLLAYRNYLV